MILKRALVVLTLLISSVTYAGRESGGGDEDGLNFKNIALSALVQFKSEFSQAYVQFASKGLEQIVANAKILVVDKDLTLQIDGQTQSSVATNSPDTNTILVNRKLWNDMSPAMKEGIALHEILSLIGVEKTGYYRYSSEYVLKKGVAPLEFISLAYEPYNCFSNALKQGIGSIEGAIQLCAGSSSPTAPIECFLKAHSTKGWNDLAATLLCSGAHSCKEPMNCHNQMWTEPLFKGWTSENIVRTCRGTVSATKTIECIRNAFNSSKNLTVFGAALLCTGNLAQMPQWQLEK